MTPSERIDAHAQRRRTISGPHQDGGEDVHHHSDDEQLMLSASRKVQVWLKCSR